MRPSRLAPLSFALCIAVSGVAFAAAPVAPTHESAIKSAAVSLHAGFKTFRSDYKEHRAAAGPGFFKRQAMKVGGALKSLTIGVVNAKDRLVAHVSAKLAAHVERVAAQKDMNALVKENGLQAFHGEANKEAGVRGAKVARALNTFNIVGGAAIAPIHPVIGGAISAFSISQAGAMKQDVRARQRQANTTTLLHAIETGKGEGISEARLASWSKAGLVDRQFVDVALNAPKTAAAPTHTAVANAATKAAPKLVGRNALGQFTKLTEDAPVAAAKETTKAAPKLVGRNAQGQFTKLTEDAPVAAAKETTKAAPKLVGRNAQGQFTKLTEDAPVAAAKETTKAAPKLVGRNAQGQFTKLTEDAPVATAKEAKKAAPKTDNQRIADILQTAHRESPREFAKRTSAEREQELGR